MKIIFNIKALILMSLAITIVSCSEDNSFSPQNPGANMPSGLYMGIIGFSNDLSIREIDRLTPENQNKFTNYVTYLKSGDATLLYYGIDMSIERLLASKLPDDVDNVAIVTFTDGLDQGSHSKTSEYRTDEKYMKALNTKIKTSKVQGREISAYTIGLRGNDVKDFEKFDNNLNYLSSSPDNAYKVSNMSEVNARFREIADKLYNETTSQSVTLRIPYPEDGEIIRFTFDNVIDAQYSNCYIQGTFNLADQTLRGITYKGLTSDGKRADLIKKISKRENVHLYYTFDDIKLDNSNNKISTYYAKQWVYVPTSKIWEKNTEFNPNSQSEVTVERKSAAVMLVLDCSTSLGTEFSTLKSNANSFIKIMANGVK